MKYLTLFVLCMATTSVLAVEPLPEPSAPSFERYLISVEFIDKDNGLTHMERIELAKQLKANKE